MLTQPRIKPALQVFKLTPAQLLLKFGFAQLPECLGSLPRTALLARHRQHLSLPHLGLTPVLMHPQSAPCTGQRQTRRQHTLLRARRPRQRARTALLEQTWQSVE
ncbi:hypothetical protein D3C78_1395640 [compost metagenome]